MYPQTDPPPKEVKEVGHEEENTWVYFTVLFIVSKSQQEINVYSTAIIYQLFKA